MLCALTAWGTCVPNQPASTTTSSLAVHLHYGINITGPLIYLTHITGLFLPPFQFDTSRVPRVLLQCMVGTVLIKVMFTL